MYLACPDLPAALAAGRTIITPTPFLANVVKEQFVQTQLGAGLQSWSPPAVYSIGAWMTDAWQQARYAGAGVPSLLSLAQERSVWQDLMQAIHPGLFDYAGAIGLAIASTRSMAEWHIPLDGEPWSLASDTRHFQELLQRFRQRSAKEGWITRGDLWRLVPDWVGQPWFDSRPLTFAAFQTVPPALASLLNRLGVAAQQVSVHLTPAKSAMRVEREDFTQQLEICARWARHRYESEPKASVGLLIPDLASRAVEARRVLRSVFLSGTDLSCSDAPEPFSIHASQSLTSQPVIASALLLLKLGEPRVEIAAAGAILRSPFVAGATSERSARAHADLHLRRYRDLDVSLRDMEAASANCAGWKSIWSTVRPLLQAMPGKLELSEWSEWIGRLVTAAGWPGNDDLTATEQAAVESWKSTLTELSALSSIAQPMSFPEAVEQLGVQLAAPLPATGDLSAPVQVVDASAAYGLRFDYSAALGLSEEEWPPSARPSPFLPFPLQRPILANHLNLRTAATAALFATAPTIMAAYAGMLAPAVEQHTKATRKAPLVWTGLLPGQVSPSSLSEELIEDGQAPPFQAVGTSAPGGVSILKSQSQCPFQAFATYRLSARRPEDACFGFDARERGSFLHRALEAVWTQLQTRDRLRATGVDDRRAIVRSAVEAAVGRQDDSPFHELSGEAERERLEDVILEWLTLEENRQQPFTVEHVEKAQSLAVGGLPLNIRIDRVDRLSDGSAVLIDYKSGEPKLKSLEGPRPAEPQLLVYATALRERVEGVFFAQLKPRALKAIGWSHTTQFPAPPKSKIKNVRSDWDTFLQQSADAVENIALEFLEGCAVVEPQPGACTFCNLKPFCRINEAGAHEDADDVD